VPSSPASSRRHGRDVRPQKGKDPRNLRAVIDDGRCFPCGTFTSTGFAAAFEGHKAVDGRNRVGIDGLEGMGRIIARE